MSESSKNHLYYLNALFDFYLGGYPVGKLSRSASEMSTLFAFMGNDNDRVLLDIALPDNFISYLHSIGIALLQPFDNKWGETPFQGIPWGWDINSYKRLKETGAICETPDLEIVKKVNSRQFHNHISKEYGLGVPGSAYCGTLCSYVECIERIEDPPVVVKPSFGGSGFGFRIIQNEEQGKLICKDIDTLMHHGGVIIEPWCKRIHDFSSSITIHKDGRISRLRHQRSFSNTHGTFVGIYMSPSDPVLQEYAHVQENAVRKAAEMLLSNGYFGPAGFDSFSYTDKNGNERIAPVIEINARHSMSDVAHAIRNKCAPEKFCFFRLISKKRCNLPDTYQKWIDLMGEDHFNIEKQEGVILVTPLQLQYGNNFVQPARNGFFIAGSSEEELFERDKRLRERVEKGKASLNGKLS